jgi:hypothetical protein
MIENNVIFNKFVCDLNYIRFKSSGNNNGLLDV